MTDNTWDDTEVISSYTWEQGVEDGSPVEVFKNRWPELTHGKPLLATIALHSAVNLAALREIWNEYVEWKQAGMPTRSEVDRFFSTTMNGKKVWVIDNGSAFIMMYPEDY